MAKHAHISRYFADDKDIFDLLSASNLTVPRLLRILRQRGILMSHLLSRDELIRRFQTYVFDWTQFDELVSALDRPDREEKYSTCELSGGIKLTSVESAITTLSEQRSSLRAEAFAVTKSGEGTLNVKVKYSETDPSKTRALQRRERELTINVEEVDGTLKIRHHDNVRAQEIINELEGLLIPGSDQSSRRRSIDLSGLPATKRTDFFVALITGIEGTQIEDVSDLKVERPEQATEQEQEAEEDSSEESEELAGLVKRAVLNGSGLLYSDEYQRLVKAGFFISNVAWTALETAGDRRRIEFLAEFRDPEQCRAFRYDVRGVYLRNDDGELRSSRIPVRGAEKTGLLQKVETSAFAAIEELTSGAEAANEGNADEQGS